MRYAFCTNGAGDFNAVVDLACEAEEGGWDGFFIPDGIAISVPNHGPFPLADPWVMLGALASRTKRIRIGPMITPVPRRRPWKIASECITVDHLSKGRLILCVGLGAASDDGGFFKVGEAMDLKVRAQRLDEGLAIINGLWGMKPFTFKGDHFQVDDMTMFPGPVQSPRIPIWVVGVWNKPKSMRRVVSWDGVIPQKYNSMEPLSPSDVKALADYVAANRSNQGSFDIVAAHNTPGTDRKRASQIVKPYIEAGATWWLEPDWSFSSFEQTRERVKQGPPRPD